MEKEQLDPSVFKTILSLFKTIAEDAYENGRKSIMDYKSSSSDILLSTDSKCHHDKEEKKESDVESEDCPICMETLDTNVIVTHCEHKFHSNCLMEWNLQNTTCPLCRAELGSSEDGVSEREEKKVYVSDDEEDFSTWENPLEHLFEDPVMNDLRNRVKRRLNDLRLETSYRFQCPCGSNISRASGHQHFQSNRHTIWLHELSEQSLRDILNSIQHILDNVV